MAPKTGGKEDPIEKIGRMIDEKVRAAFEGRDRTEQESKDPWARIEGLIDRTVGKHFEEFAKGLEEGEGAGSSSAGGKAPKADEGEGDDIITQLFGGGRGR